MRHLIPISGKDSATTAIVQRTLEPDLPYEYIFNQIGSELPEMAEWLTRMEDYLGQPIIRIGGDLIETIYAEGILPSQLVRFCTRKEKIEKMEAYIGEDEAIAYFGIRADEQRVGFKPSKGVHIAPRFPLVEQGWRLEHVWAALEHLDLLPPQFYWERMERRVREKLGENAGWLDLLKPWQRAMLFAWRSRSNCFHCFNQRIYEWVGLLEFHPDLFWKSAEIEEEVGAKGFYWMNNGRSLRSIAARAESVFEERATAICQAVGRLANLRLFEDESSEPTILSVTSCGLFCGK